MQDLTSRVSVIMRTVRNYTGRSCQWSQGSWDHSVLPIVFLVTKPWRTEILQRPQGPPAQDSTCTVPYEVFQWFRELGESAVVRWDQNRQATLCSAEQRNSYRFGTTRGSVNDDRIFIFGWTIPLMTWRRSAKRSGTKSLLRCVQAWWPTTRSIWPLCLPTRVLPPSTKPCFVKGSNTYLTH